MPSLLAGSAYGFLCLEAWVWVYPNAGDSNDFSYVHPGLFIIVGAASGLGGMARMTISLAVILMELTGVVQWGPPIMVSLLAARFTGNYFNEGLYDLHVHLKVTAL